MTRDIADHSLGELGRVRGDRVRVIDMHTAGEPLRIIVDAPIMPAGATILAQRRDAIERWDHLRRALMFEPRGHPDMYGALIVPAIDPASAFGVLFTHNEGYSTMCGHAIIALGRAAVELGWITAVEGETVFGVDTPAGSVVVHVRVTDGRACSTWFKNVPSFVDGAPFDVTVDGIGAVSCAIAFGGAYYAFVDADALGLALDCASGSAIVDLGMRIKRAVMRDRAIVHPEADDLGFLYGTIFTSRRVAAGVHSRHACVFAEGALDRSPTGTGVSARLALLDRDESLPIGVPVVIDSITGGRFTGRIARTVDYHRRRAVVPEVEGSAHFTGESSFVIEPDDIIGAGFLVR